jgi:hypothetical protein
MPRFYFQSLSHNNHHSNGQMDDDFKDHLGDSGNPLSDSNYSFDAYQLNDALYPGYDQNFVIGPDNPEFVLSGAGQSSGGSVGGATSNAGSALVTNTASTGLTINVIYDSTVNNAPSGFKTEVGAAVQYLESQFKDPITITIDVGYGEVGGSKLGRGVLGESSTFLNSYSYSDLVTAMKLDAKSASDTSAIASLLATDPTGGAGTYWVSTAEAKALGLAPNDTSVDGYVGFSKASGIFDYNNANGVTSNEYDFYGVVLHEITEVMGRQTMDGNSFYNTTAYEPLDLFHYSAPGVQTFSGTTPGYFSINGGVTNLANFNTNSSGDFGDWAGPSADAMNAFGTPGVVEPMTPADITALDVLGWDTVCFMAGTMIRTPNGEVTVETLQHGDLVLTTDGRVAPVSWVGRQTVSTRFSDPLRVLPIRIKAGALGENVPSRDFLLSPDHAILIEDILVHAGALVNGTTIIREANVPQIFTYFHVELEDHSLILAENTPAETFIDNVDRLGFDNWQEHEALYPFGKPIVEMPYPRAKAHRQVPRVIREKLAERAIVLMDKPQRAA